jgi:SAM-dependent methyltransferase
MEYDIVESMTVANRTTSVVCTACSADVQGPPAETHREPVYGREFGIYRCPRCGVTFSPIPADFPLREWYSKAGHLYGKEEWIMHPSPEEDWRFNHFLETAGRLNLSGNILDVGSGDGRFLMRASVQGWRGDLTGLEFNPDMASRRQGNYKVEIAPIEEFTTRPGRPSFDVVTIYDVLEHLAEPAKSLSNIVKLIKPGGHLAITVPNGERLRFAGLEMFDFPPNHNTRWTGKALSGLVERAGLEVLEVTVNPFKARMLSDQLFYKLFWRAMPLVKRILFGSKAASGKTLTDLLAAEGASSAIKGAIAGKGQRRKIEAALRNAFGVLLTPLLLPAYLILPLFLPHRQGDCLFLLARKKS